MPATPREPLNHSPLRDYVANAYNSDQGGETFSVLILSSGGQYGAYGAGVLNEIFEKPSKGFDMICASSIGAIMGSHAFLAHKADSPSSREDLRRFFVDTNQKDWYRKKGFFGLLFSPNSLYATEPLRQHIKTLVTKEVFEAVKQEAINNPQRKLLVSTVNADQGYRQLWDLSRIAVLKDYEYYIDVLMAAGAVPLFFPAKFTNKDSFSDLRLPEYVMHTDGGVMAPIFYHEILDVIPKGGRKPVVDIVQNGFFRARPYEVRNTVVSHLRRTLDLLVVQVRESSLSLIAKTLKDKGGAFRYTHVPDDFKLNEEYENGLSFNQDTMRRLYEEGLSAKWITEDPAPAMRGPFP